MRDGFYEKYKSMGMRVYKNVGKDEEEGYFYLIRVRALYCRQRMDKARWVGMG